MRVREARPLRLHPRSQAQIEQLRLEPQLFGAALTRDEQVARMDRVVTQTFAMRGVQTEAEIADQVERTRNRQHATATGPNFERGTWHVLGDDPQRRVA